MIEGQAISERNTHHDSSDAMVEDRPSKTIARMVVVGLIAVFAISIFYEPSKPDSDGSYFTICPFKFFTNLPCPGCGLTHSFCSIGKGDIESGFTYNLLGPPLFLLAILIFFRSVCVLVGWTKPALVFDRTASRIKLLHIVLVSLFVFGGARIIYLIFSKP